MRNLTFIILTMLLMTFAPIAKADERWDGIHVMCLPELNNFELDTFPVDLDYDSQNRVDNAPVQKFDEKIKSEHEIYTVSDFLHKPFSCDLPGRKIEVTVKDYQPARERGECAALDHFSLGILVNGTEIYSFHAYGINRCTDPERHILSIDAFGYLRDCKISDDGPPSCDDHLKLSPMPDEGK